MRAATSSGSSRILYFFKTCGLVHELRTDEPNGPKADKSNWLRTDGLDKSNN